MFHSTIPSLVELFGTVLAYSGSLYLVTFVLSATAQTTFNVTVGGLGGQNGSVPIIAYTPSSLVRIHTLRLLFMILNDDLD